MKSFKGILVLGERHIFNELSKLIAVATQANNVIKVMFKAGYEDQALKENMAIMHNLEKKADEMAFRLGEDITGGAISPNIIDNLIQCVHVADDIVDLYYYLSRELYRMSKADAKGFAVNREAEWVTIYESLFNLADKALERLRETLHDSVPLMLELRKEIEILENEGDDIKDAGFDKLYSEAHQLHYLQFRHYSELLQKCDDILDNCEDLSDLVVSVVTSILK